MKKEMIVQFVCFETVMGFDEFVVQWERYAKKLLSRKADDVTLLQEAEVKNKYKYISLNTCGSDDFNFVFMKGRLSDHFPEGGVKVVQAGGYMPLQMNGQHNKGNDDIKIFAFITDARKGPDLYKEVEGYRKMNIYEAYYESCRYAYIIEFFTQEINAAGIVSQIKNISPGTETAMYRESMVVYE
ncbi:MAG: hypothetical protein SFU87_05150 [Chitinophagaceae bacterium]|nr:hypothetical protein [Chitinophagaceae bacterium]